MDVLAAIFACSLHADYELVRAIALSNARQNPLTVFVGADSAVTHHEPRTVLEAAARFEAVRAQGHRALLGLMLVPPEWAEQYGQPASALFDACANVSIGSAVLEKVASSSCRRAVGLEARRECLLKRYEVEIGVRDFAAVVELQLDYLPRISPDAAAAGAPVFAPTAARTWGADRVFFNGQGNTLVFLTPSGTSARALPRLRRATPGR